MASLYALFILLFWLSGFAAGATFVFLIVGFDKAHKK
jgi:hypothetical protein